MSMLIPGPCSAKTEFSRVALETHSNAVLLREVAEGRCRHRMTSSQEARNTPSRCRSTKRHLVPVMIAVLVFAVAARLWTNRHLNLLNTLDSFDYLRLSQDLAAGDWSSSRLGGIRLPGYPAFLAVLDSATGLGAKALLVAQQSLGTISALLLAWCGFKVAGWRGGLGLGLFAALHPALLLFEHQAMSESLSTACMVALSAAFLLLRTSGFRMGHGLLLGALSAASLLIRANGLFLVAGISAAGLLESLRPAMRPDAHRSLLRSMTFGACLLAGSSVLLGPWLWRMQRYTGRPTLVETKATRFVYLAQYGLLNPDLPLWRRLNMPYRPDRPESIWQTLRLLQVEDWRHQVPQEPDLIFASGFEDPSLRLEEGWSPDPLSPKSEGHREQSPGLSEALAEQLGANRPALRAARLHASASFLGLAGPFGGTAPGQDDVLYWFRNLVATDPSSPDAQPPRLTRAFERYLPGSSVPPERPGSQIWSRAGEIYVLRFRPLLVAATLFVAPAIALRSRERRDRFGWLLLGGLVATALLHGWMLAGYDRFAIPFDPLLALAAVALVCGRELDADSTEVQASSSAPARRD